MSKFNPDGAEYDQSTYTGRLRRFFNMINPLLLLPSDEEVLKEKSKIELYRQLGENCGYSSEELWKSKRLVDSAIHPDTGEILGKVFRIAMFVPVNTPIVIAMTLAPQTLFNAVFWQWINQTYNAAFNYGNANKTNEGGMKALLTAYTAATTVSVGTAVGLREIVQRAKITDAMRVNLMRLVPFTAVATAGVANAVLMRINELMEGITVQDSEGNNLPGKSFVAAKVGLSQVALSRVVLAAQVILLPALFIPVVKRIPNYPKSKIGDTAIGCGIVIGALWCAVPVAVAAFPQNAKLHKTQVEEHFQILSTPDEYVYFNKGL
eukprot:GHVL01041877.1.p1 GENE.GHVL01041877.1~~GHVL01041877.1.p1  ORF type:complete len:341 (+),score=44.53 GHVL01041877.1:62-1024(+)